MKRKAPGSTWTEDDGAAFVQLGAKSASYGIVLFETFLSAQTTKADVT